MHRRTVRRRTAWKVQGLRDLSFLAYPGLVALRRPLAGAAFVLVILVATAAALPGLYFDNEVNRAYVSNGNRANETADPKRAASQIILLVRSRQPFSASQFGVLRDISFDLELLEDVVGVVSVASLRFPKRHADHPGEAILPFDLERDEIRSRLAAYEQAATGSRSLISRDRNKALILLTLEDRSVDLDRVVSQVNETIELHAEGGLSFSMTGEGLIGREMVRALSHDLIVFNVAGGILALVLAFLVFGNPQYVALACVPAFFAAFASLGIFLLLGWPITVVNNVVPVLVLVLGLADSVHLVLFYRDDSEGSSVQERARHTLFAVGPACGLTAITTSIAFLAVALTQNAVLRELAVTGALAVFAGYVVVLVAFAVMVPYLGKHSKSGSLRNWIGVPPSACRAILANAKGIVASSLVVLIVSLLAVGQLRAWFELNNNLPSTSEVHETNRIVSEEFGGAYRLWIDVDYAPEESVPEDWERLREVTAQVRQAVPDATVLSLATYAEWLGTPDAPPDPDAMDNLPEAVRTQLVQPEGSRATIVVLVPEPMASEEALAQHDALEAVAARPGVQRLSGLPMILRHEPVVIVRELSMGLGLACLLATGLIALAFRSAALIPILILPNLLPLAVTAAALYPFYGGHITPTAMLALTVAFGIAVDDSIHFLNRAVRERRRNSSVSEALVVAINRTSRPMIVTTLLISLGIGVTFFSAFNTVKLFGGMLILTFTTALAADLLVLPCLLKMRWAKP